MCEIDKDCTAGCKTCLLTSINTTVNVTGIRKRFRRNEKSTWDRLKLNSASSGLSKTLLSLSLSLSLSLRLYVSKIENAAVLRKLKCFHSERDACVLFDLKHYAVKRARTLLACLFRMYKFLTLSFLPFRNAFYLEKINEMK